VEGFDELYDFLQSDEEVTVDPSLVEGGEFSPSGFIAPWRSRLLYRHGCEQDFSVEEAGWTIRQKMGDWGWGYYFDTPEKAAAAKEIMGRDYNAQSFWCFETVTADIINFASEEARANWGSDVFWDWQTAGVRARKHVEFHHLILPAIVAAYATAKGFDVPAFDISPLLDLETDHELGWDDMDRDEQDAIYHQCLPLVGGKHGSDEVKKDDAFFWKQRAELWKALGEDNPEACQLIRHAEEYSTKSEKLDLCLRLYYYLPWKNALWARVAQLPSPRPDALTKAGKRLKVPLLLDLYPTQAAAQEAAGDRTTAGEATDSLPEIPTMWQDIPDEFKAKVRELKASGKPPAVAIAAGGGEESLGMTLEDVNAWLPHV
jgi:hypothetical protein